MMKNLYYNDTAYIAQSFQLSEEYTSQTARLACFKINSYKLSFSKTGLSTRRGELADNLKNSLLNYIGPDIVLDDLGFFYEETEN